VKKTSSPPPRFVSGGLPELGGDKGPRQRYTKGKIRTKILSEYKWPGYWDIHCSHEVLLMNPRRKCAELGLTQEMREARLAQFIARANGEKK